MNSSTLEKTSRWFVPYWTQAQLTD